jgi:prepilin-type N-terminal cleavage/methylation domain-containing protein
MRCRGFTLIELIVVICAVALLFGVALDRLLRYQELAERTAVELNVAAINSALTMKFAAYVTSGDPRGVETEVGKNPVALLARPPQNYLGELYSPDVRTLVPKSWYFDRQSGELVYVPGRTRYLTTTSGPPETLRFRIALTALEPGSTGPKEVPQPFVAVSHPFAWDIQ